jgi:probable O-glycosylation ligase (exosortase A-associated)
MRDGILLLILSTLLPCAIRFPFVGVYIWAWLGLMNPHRETYGFAHDMPLNMVVAIVTIGAWMFGRGQKKMRMDALTLFLTIFAIWMSITTIAAPAPDFTVPLWSRNEKTMLLLGMIIALMTTRVRIHGLVWIIVISIGYYGVKGGIFAAATGGSHMVIGPEGSMIGDNNAMALASVMTIPLFNYLRLHSERRIVRLALMGSSALILISILASYSRGGLIALTAMMGFLWVGSRAKGVIAVAVAVGALLVFNFMPQQYLDRINTIQNAQEDESFRGRLSSWYVAWNVALDRPLGAGFDGPRQPAIWNQYLPNEQSFVSHSIYFMVLGEHGFIGLGLYLIILFIAWRNFRRVLYLTRDAPKLLWARDLAFALQVSMIGFLIGGAALPVAYYDGFLSLLALGAALRKLVEEETAVQNEGPRRAGVGISNGSRPLSPRGEIAPQAAAN